jgi:hypothetical protein
MAKSSFSYPAALVWAAACAAQRVNGGYVKVGSGPAEQMHNRMLMESFITDQSVTDADRAEGEKVRKFYQALTFQILKGKLLSSFDNNALALSNREEITSNYEIAVIASLPDGYERGQKRMSVQTRIDFAKGGFIARVGEKVTANIEVLRSAYSQQWNVYFVTAITDQDQAIFFSFKSALEAGANVKIAGTIKAHRDNQTQLNRVKVL